MVHCWFALVASACVQHLRPTDVPTEPPDPTFRECCQTLFARCFVCVKNAFRCWEVPTRIPANQRTRKEHCSRKHRRCAANSAPGHVEQNTVGTAPPLAMSVPEVLKSATSKSGPGDLKDSWAFWVGWIC